ncbi:hypothetical protein [Azospirillum sp. sgz301742]
MDRFRPVIAALALIGVLATQTPAARAEDKDDGASSRAPRVTVQIGELNVVLVSSDDQLYAFVDRIEDNAPAEDAAITVTRTGSRSPLEFTKASSGLFVAPYKRTTGLLQDVFTVSVESADGTGEQKATLVYEAAPVAAVRSTNGSFGRLLSIALVSGMIGSVATVLLMRRARRGHRADPPPPLVRVA